MTKSELRKARKEARASGLPLIGDLALDHDQNTNVDFSAEHLRNGKINHRRYNALQRNARFVYDYDRE